MYLQSRFPDHCPLRTLPLAFFCCISWPLALETETLSIFHKLFSVTGLSARNAVTCRKRAWCFWFLLRQSITVNLWLLKQLNFVQLFSKAQFVQFDICFSTYSLWWITEKTSSGILFILRMNIRRIASSWALQDGRRDTMTNILESETRGRHILVVYDL